MANRHGRRSLLCRAAQAARETDAWGKARACKQAGKVHEGVVRGQNRGGILIDCWGVQGALLQRLPQSGSALRARPEVSGACGGSASWVLLPYTCRVCTRCSPSANRGRHHSHATADALRCGSLRHTQAATVHSVASTAQVLCKGITQQASPEQGRVDACRLHPQLAAHEQDAAGGGHGGAGAVHRGGRVQQPHDALATQDPGHEHARRHERRAGRQGAGGFRPCRLACPED